MTAPALAVAPGTRRMPMGPLLTTALAIAGSVLLVVSYGNVLPVIFVFILTFPIAGWLATRGVDSRQDLTIFLRSIAVGLLASGIGAYYAVILRDPYQLASDAASFFQLASQAGPARSLQDLATITEGAGAVVLWHWIYNAAAVLGFPREPYIGISANIVLVATSMVVCSRSARSLFGHDEYRFGRLMLFVTICGDLWLFAGLHLRDSSILLTVAVVMHFWVRYLAQLEHKRVMAAMAATLAAMPLLSVLRQEFFYVPLLIGVIGIACLNFSRGRGDTRFITTVSVLFGAALAVIALVVFGRDILNMFSAGQETYGDLVSSQSRSGSLGSALIVERGTFLRIILGVPYLLYFPIPFWTVLTDNSAISLFKGIHAVSFYAISAFLWTGAYMIVTQRHLRSPAFLFVLLVPLVLAVSITLTSLETRHLGVFMPSIFLVALLPDYRVPAERAKLRLALFTIFSVMALVHIAWLAIRFV